MTLDEAIEILDNYLSGDEPDYAPDLPASIRLGIDALKRHRDYPLHTLDGIYQPLQGETPE